MEETNFHSGVWSVIRREPLVYFLVAGAIVYGVWVMLAPSELETVRIEAATLRALEKQQVDLLGRPLTDEEKVSVREGFIEDEVLLREALGRGLQWSDFRVRQRLTRIMRSALTETVADPSVTQLQAYFRDNIDKYSSPESMTFEQVLFPWGEDISEEEIEAVLVALRTGADPGNYGSNSAVARPLMPREARASLVRIFGASFADSVERLPEGEWHGPLESVHGIHLVRLSERHPPEVAVFENVESYLRQDWLVARTRKLQQEGIDEIRAGYRIEVVEESAAE